MPRPKRAEPPILAMLEKAFAKYRKKVKPLFPYDAQTNVIRLPQHIEEELRHWVLTGKPVEAVKRRRRIDWRRVARLQRLRRRFGRAAIAEGRSDSPDGAG